MRGTLGSFEQYVVAAILLLGDNARMMKIQGVIHERTLIKPAVGALYTTLKRLQTKGLISSDMGKPTPVRGGRRNRFYKMKPKGIKIFNLSLSTSRAMFNGLDYK